MNIPENLKYTEEHEWIKIEEGNIAIVGVTDYAQGELGDVVYVEVESVDEELEQNAVFGTIEAVKTVSDLYLPVAGKVIEKNEALEEAPETVNSDPYNKGWLIKLEVANIADLDNLLSSESYSDFVGKL